MARSDIEWLARPGTVPESWNPVTGCNMNGKRYKTSPGCDHCWAERMARRLNGRCGYPKMPHHFDVTLHEDRLSQPSRWRKPRTVFVVSMGDLFHKAVPDSYRYKVWVRMVNAPLHTFIVCTKHSRRMMEWTRRFYGLQPGGDMIGPEWLAPNIWGLVTVESQEQAGRIDDLMLSPFVVRGVSVEPMLGVVDLKRVERKPGYFRNMLSYFNPLGHRLDWIIAGCESGPGRRPAERKWFVRLRDQCVEAGIPFFLKQMEVGGKVVKMPELEGQVWDIFPR
jgi:protein gp37